jgi:hypothetical protein
MKCPFIYGNRKKRSPHCMNREIVHKIAFLGEKQYTVISCLIGKQSKLFSQGSREDLGNCWLRPLNSFQKASDNSFPGLH